MCKNAKSQSLQLDDHVGVSLSNSSFVEYANALLNKSDIGDDDDSMCVQDDWDFSSLGQ